MKILHITPEAPGYYSGGRIGVLQTALSITSHNNVVDYIGPDIENEDIKSLYNKLYFPAKTKNPFFLFINTIKGITNKSYNAWKKLDIDYSIYDYIVLDFTKQSYLLEKINNKNLVVRVHNVEYDYSRRSYSLNKSLKNLIIKHLSFKQESTLVNKATKVVTLTENDTNRIIELYRVSREKIVTVPVCVQNANGRNTNNNTNTLLITGSLWFGGNYDGIKWFINNVYIKLKTKPGLVIAGSNPNDELISLSEKIKGITLYKNPSDMSKFFLTASLSIAPVFDGAGMKVKVAEALSYGLPVVGTPHALIGYDIKNGFDSFEADSSEDFIKIIDDYFSLSTNERENIKSAAYKLYEDKYSMVNSTRLWNSILS